MSDESLEQPSPLKYVPSIASGDATGDAIDDTIGALQRERETLRAEVRALKGELIAWKHSAISADAQEMEIEKLEVENERLRGDHAEYLCESCDCVHPNVGTTLLQLCPVCQGAMIPSSYNLREIIKLRAQVTTMTQERDILRDGWHYREENLHAQLAASEARVKELEKVFEYRRTP